MGFAKAKGSEFIVTEGKLVMADERKTCTSPITSPNERKWLM